MIGRAVTDGITRAGEAQGLALVSRDGIEGGGQDVQVRRQRWHVPRLTFAGLNVPRQLALDVVVGDGVAPGDQRPEALPALGVAAARYVYLRSDIEAEAIKVLGDRVGCAFCLSNARLWVKLSRSRAR